MDYGNTTSRAKSWKKMLRSPVVLVVALIALFVLARAAWNMHKSASLVSTRLSRSQAELEHLQAEQAELSRKVDSLSTAQGIETELRTKYRAVKEGESVAVIIDKDKVASTTSPSAAGGGAADGAESSNWWSRLMGSLGF